jgi:ribosomal protein L29
MTTFPKMSELESLSSSDLKILSLSLESELIHLGFQNKRQVLKDTSQIKKMKHKIAQIKLKIANSH